MPAARRVTLQYDGPYPAASLERAVVSVEAHFPRHGIIVGHVGAASVCDLHAASDLSVLVDVAVPISAAVTSAA